MDDRTAKEDRPQGTELVDIIASGYEWLCPRCDTLNKEIEYLELVTCQNDSCGVSFHTSLPEHALG